MLPVLMDDYYFLPTPGAPNTGAIGIGQPTPITAGLNELI